MIEFAITAFCLGVQPEQGAWDEFVAATRRSIPDHGSLFLEYESDASSAVLLLGADIGSGAWYKIAFYPNQPNDLRFSKSVGREPSGAGFRGLVSDGEVPVWKVEPAALSDAAVDEFIPLVAVKALPSLGENVVAVETDSAGWRLRFKLGNGMRQFVEGWLPSASVQYHEVEYLVSPDCRLLSVKNTTRGDTIDFSANCESKDGFQIVMRTPRGWRLKKSAVVVGGEPSRFSRLSVGMLAGEARRRSEVVGVRYQLDGTTQPAGARDVDRDRGVREPNNRDRAVLVRETQPKESWSSALIAAGAIVCIIGGWYLWRARWGQR